MRLLSGTERPASLFLLFLLSVTLFSFLTSAATSFCKCTCFSNSTIIALNPPHTSPTSSTSPHALLPRKSEEDKQHRALNCNDCNRKFCLDYNLKICKGAKEEDVFTTCFQRDSRKDEAVVFIFIFATASLLIWAGMKPWVEKWVQSARERRTYLPVSGDGDNS